MRVRVTVDGRRVHEGPATAVVVANGQYLRGADVVPRGHPGDGRAEVHVYALARSERRRMRERLPRGEQVPHPRIGTTSGRRILIESLAAPVALEVDRVAVARAATRDRRRDARGILTPAVIGEESWVHRAPSARRYHRPSPGERRPRPVGVYTLEQFTDEEAAVLRPYFTNLDQPVFALVNLPEVVKGALFARYSRTHKSLRRLFLDEFVSDLDLTGDLTVDATVGLRRAEELYERVFMEYGDDSVAQLGGVHLACEQSSNLLTKILEWGRLMAYLEQSTRYIPYDNKLGGRYRYYRDSAVLADRDLAWRYIADMDALFETYSQMLPTLVDWARRALSQGPGRLALRLQADDQGQGLRRRAWDPPGRRRCRMSASTAPVRHSRRCSCACARTRSRRRASYAATMLEELRKVIPSFLARVDREDRGVVWSAYLAETRASTRRARRPAVRR